MRERNVREARALLEENLERIQTIITWTARRKRMKGDEEQDLTSYIYLKLVDDDYRILRRFRGESRLRTYLAIVIQRLTLDFCARRWGRWRSSAEARRLGPVAVRLEQLLYRDGYTLDEAAALLTNGSLPGTGLPGAGFTGETAVAELAQRLPARIRRRFEGEESLRELAAPSAPRSLPIEDRRDQRRIESLLQTFLSRLPADDRRLLALHFSQGRKVSEIARSLRVKQRPLYTRIHRCLRQMRRLLEAEGIRRERVCGLLECQDFHLWLDFQPAASRP